MVLTLTVSKAEIPLKALSPVNSPSMATNEASSIADKTEGSAAPKLSEVTSIAAGGDGGGGDDQKGHKGKGVKRGRTVPKNRTGLLAEARIRPHSTEIRNCSWSAHSTQSLHLVRTLPEIPEMPQKPTWNRCLLYCNKCFPWLGLASETH